MLLRNCRPATSQLPCQIVSREASAALAASFKRRSVYRRFLPPDSWRNPLPTTKGPRSPPQGSVIPLNQNFHSARLAPVGSSVGGFHRTDTCNPRSPRTTESKNKSVLSHLRESPHHGDTLSLDKPNIIG